ncbi:MAG: hypothetical protein ACI4WM_10245 [Erysipelotrichaceae bacterium]
MKKILLSLSLLMVLCACSSSSEVKISNGDEVIWSSSKDKYTSQNLFDDMKKNDYSSKIVTSILNKTAVLDGIDTTSTDEELGEGYDYYVEMLGQDTVNYYFGSRENYIKSYRTSEIISKYFEQEVLSDYDTYVDTYKPYKAQIIYFDDEAAADKTIETFKAGENTFAYAASEAGYGSEVTEQIYTDKSDLPVEVKEVALNSSEPQCVKVITSTVQTDSEGNSVTKGRYYVVNIISTDAEEFKDEFVDHVVTNYIDSETVVANVLNKHNVKFYDQETYDYMKEAYPGIN